MAADAPSPDAPGPRWRAYGWALVSVLACTLIAALMHGRFAQANLVMVYLVGTLPVALRGDPWAAIAAALLSVLAFDWFFVPPFFTFAVADTQYVFVFVAMGLVGSLISFLTARLAAEIRASRERELRARALYALSQSLLAARDPTQRLAEGARTIGRILGRSVAAWFSPPQGGPVPVLAEPADALSPAESAVLLGVMRDGAPAGPGTRNLPGLARLFLPVRSPTRVHGAISIAWPAGMAETQESREIRETLETGANQIAVALDQAEARAAADAAQRAAESERLRSAVLSMVSHDLRTPLTGIVGAASSLVEGAEALPAEIRVDLARGIVEEGERLGRIITNLLHATRLEAESVQLDGSWFGLEEALQPALGRFAAEWRSRPLTIDIPPDFPLIFADAVLIEHVLVNLLENTIVHTPPGTTVSLRAWTEADRAWVEVADAGPGLPPGAEERIFEKGIRLAGPATPGMGLGLAICRGAVVAHRGGILAANCPAGGAAFRFWLPLVPPPAIPQGA